MMNQHMNSYSGQSYDKWVERNASHTTFGKVQKQFWFTKSAVIRKLGKKEDEHVVASDAELDAKIDLFRAIESSTRELQGLLADYQNKLCVLAQEENALGRLLKEYGKQDKNRAGKMMNAAGKSLCYTAQQRVALRNPLVRLFQEVDTFHTRAVQDTLRTVTDMEKIRTEYRGALMWMKNISQDFNPDQYQQLEKFREVQAIVKTKKSNFDKIKIKSLQKTDLLAASRCNMFSHALILYQNSLITFSEKTSKTLGNVADNFKGYHPYEFQVIKELAEPDLKMSEDEQEEEGTDALEGDDSTFFNAEYHDEKDETKSNQKRKKSKKTKKSENSKSDSLLNLLDLTDKTNSSQCDEAGTNEDLLTSNPEVPDTEKDTKQLLKELFDSPERQTLPVFGTDIPSNAEEIVSNELLGSRHGNLFELSQCLDEQTNADNIFLPSQLLDFGMENWSSSKPLNLRGSLASQGNTMSQFTKNIFPSTTQTSMGVPQATSSGTSTDNKPKISPKSRKKTFGGTAGDSGKVDWYKVFQDIDPLADPGGALFGKVSDEEKQC